MQVYEKARIPAHLQKFFKPAEYGLEASPAAYVETMRALFAELRRVLADDGTCWLNLGDSYSDWNSGYKPNAPSNVARGKAAKNGGAGSIPVGSKPKPGYKMPPKNLLGIPWRVAFALQDDGWILRNAIIWNKPNAMPESVTDRLSGRYEHVFLFSKSRKYWFDLDAIREPHDFPGKSRTLGRAGGEGKSSKRPDAELRMQVDGHAAGKNPGDVWTIPTAKFPGAHFATFPPALPRRCILAGCKPGGTVLDPFNGSGTTGLAAQRTGRKYVGIDLNAEYLDLTIRTRLAQSSLDFENEGA